MSVPEKQSWLCTCGHLREHHFWGECEMGDIKEDVMVMCTCPLFKPA